VIAACDLFIGNDSGLSHIAAATGRRMIVPWGSAGLNLCRPVAPADRCIILYHDVACRAACPEIACVNHERPVECLTRIQAADVLAAAQRLLGLARHDAPPVRHRSVPLVLADR
jgi:ADP-heptose:LPS heptosyltransferase